MRTFPIAKTLILALFFACNTESGGKVEREGEPTIYSVETEDEEMNQAIREARQSLSTFDSALKSENPAFENFALKARFDTDDGGEHIWIGDITLKDGTYIGVVNNRPDATRRSVGVIPSKWIPAGSRIGCTLKRVCCEAGIPLSS